MAVPHTHTHFQFEPRSARTQVRDIAHTLGWATEDSRCSRLVRSNRNMAQPSCQNRCSTDQTQKPRHLNQEVLSELPRASVRVMLHTSRPRRLPSTPRHTLPDLMPCISHISHSQFAGTTDVHARVKCRTMSRFYCLLSGSAVMAEGKK